MGETKSLENERGLEEVDNMGSIKVILHHKIRIWCYEKGPIIEQGSLQE